MIRTVDDLAVEISWETVWERRRSDLLGYAVGLLNGDRQAAEDVLQEAAVRFWRHADGLGRLDAVDGWLHTVIRHLVVDRRRRQAARAAEVELDDQAARSPAVVVQADPAELVVDEIAVDELLATLSAAHRAVIAEVYLADRSLAEAATVLGLPLGTVKSRCHHALRALRRSEPPPDGTLNDLVVRLHRTTPSRRRRSALRTPLPPRRADVLAGPVRRRRPVSGRDEGSPARPPAVDPHPGPSAIDRG